ncbi:MAG: hypothetical protein IKF14_13495 [Atopobiaceae bacterium]|nr:hypothetical protein [Atopobiaceae bacterium]MBR3160092.1 hypothetical protein [Atopobiaceae bacterium]
MISYVACKDCAHLRIDEMGLHCDAKFDCVNQRLPRGKKPMKPHKYTTPEYGVAGYRTPDDGRIEGCHATWYVRR